MKIIAQIKLQATAAQADALRRTLEAANTACNDVSEVAWNMKVFKKFDLQKLCYTAIREHYGLSAQLAIRVIAKVGDAYKLDIKTKRIFRPHGSIAYDDRILSWAMPAKKVSIWTLDGRLSIKRLLRYRSYTNATARGLSAFRRQGKRRDGLPMAKKRGLWYNSANGCFGRPVASSDAAPEQLDMLLVVSRNSCGT
nr:hypothetical protein [Oscillochloris trichoides]